MSVTDRIKRAVQSFSAKDKNSMGQNLGNQFLRYGNRKPMPADWSVPLANDKELYSGYMYAAINRIASRGAYLAGESVVTVGNDTTEAQAKKDGVSVQHPYLALIDSSPTFTNYQFFSSALRYLNLRGQFYIMAIRAVGANKVGEIQEFKLLNPYEIERVWNSDHTELAGYRQYKNGMMRDIAPEMVIPVIIEYPFDNDESYSTLDAARGTQFTLKQAEDFTRSSLKNNMSAPGIVSTDVELPDQQFENFRARILSQEKGEPIFGNGSGAVQWQSMQTDLDKAGLSTINEVNRDVIVAVTGVSKTILSIEQSGVTRDTAKVQSDLFITDTIMPQLQDLIDALNQDYKNNYPDEYKKTGYRLVIDSPLGKDIENDTKETTLKKENFALFDSLVAQGYDTEVAAKYVEGQIQLTELGEPVNEPRKTTPPALFGAPAEEPDEAEEAEDTEVKQGAKKTAPKLKKIANAKKKKKAPDLDKKAEEQNRAQASATAMLKNTFINLENQMVANAVKRLQKTYKQNADIKKVLNAYDEDDIMTDREEQEYEDEAEFALGTFLGVMIPIYASLAISNRIKETGKFGTFTIDAETEKGIRKAAKMGATSHVNTISKDMLKVVREAAESGKTEEELLDMITTKFNGKISEGRANTIARTESTRARNSGQSDADRQFIEQNNLTAYKQWTTHSDNPCEFCEAMEAMPPVPFDDNFADLGDLLEVSGEVDGKMSVKAMEIGYMDIEDGGLHPNCECDYTLILED